MLASDLHVHLDGSLRTETLVELASIEGVCPAGGGDDLAERLRFHPGMTLPSCLARFGTTIGLLQTEGALTRAAAELVWDCYLDGVRHAEIRLCPVLHTRRGLAADAVVESVLRGIEDGVTRVHARVPDDWVSAVVVIAVIEGMDADEAHELVSLAARHRGSGVAGVGLAGNEALFDARRYERPFRAARDAGLHVTVHAGEGHDPSHVRDAVTVLGAERIGHGTSAADDPDVMALLRERDVAVEVCLTSNVHTGAVARIDEHPLPALIEAGVPATLATDNRFFSNTTISREYDLAAEVLDLGPEAIDRLVIAGATSAFLPAPDRATLKEIYRGSLGSRRRRAGKDAHGPR